jgi:hypothetical protein
MRYNFCTLFDSYYLTRGIALYRSLLQHCDEFHLYVFAFDEKCYSILNGLKLAHATLITLADFEDQDLLRIKSTRTIAEYCWTSTASTIWYSIHKYNLDHCTYLDADMFFFSSPGPIFLELENYSVGITSHNFSPKLKSLEIYGKYCVQFVYIKNDVNGIMVLDWWRKSCIDWCYAKFKDGKYGDQKYLDYFQEKFSGVKIISHLGAGLSYWNISNYFIKSFNNKITLKLRNDLNVEYPLIFYHYQGLKFEMNNFKVISQAAPLHIPGIALIYIYKPYISLLISIDNEILSPKDYFNEIVFKRGFQVFIIQNVKVFIKKFSNIASLYSLLKPRYNRPKKISTNS